MTADPTPAFPDEGATDDPRDRGPADKPRARTCIATREARPEAELIRFVLGPGDRVTADLRRRLPGRGAWVMASAEALGLALKRRAFARAFKRPVELPPDLVGEVAALLKTRLVEAISMANKAGLLVTGFGKVEEALLGGRAAALIHAAEAGADGRAKLAAAARRGLGLSLRDAVNPLPVIGGLTTLDLRLACGRGDVIHAALSPGPASAHALAGWRLYEGFASGLAPAAS